MADVLLVHVREDEALADSIGVSLERSGLTVARGESVFDVGDEVPCVIVLWSDVSTRSSMVRDVAIRAQREGKLVAATLGGCETPLGFSRPAPQDLSEWGGDPDDPTLDALFFAADRLVCAAKLSGSSPRARPSQPYVQRPQRAAPPPEASHEAARLARELPATPIRAMAAAPAPEPKSAAQENSNLPPNLAVETLAWKHIENSSNPQDFLDYLGHYGPKGLFSELASMKLDRLTGAGARPPKGAFMQHKPAPHVEKAAKPAARRAPEPIEAPPEPRRARPVSELPVAARAQRTEALSEIRRPETDPPSARAGVATAARRRAPAPPQTRRAAPTEGGGFPWRPIMLLAVLGAGGFALYQNLPKFAGAHSQTPPGLAEALRAAPANDDPPTDQYAGGSAPVTVDGAALTPATVTEKIKPRPEQKLAEAQHQRRKEGVGGPVLSMAPRDSGGGKPAAPPPVEFRAVGSSSAQPAASPPAGAPSYDPAPPAPTRYVQARWVLTPSAARLERFYPRNASDNGVAGSVVLDCAILQSGRLNCVPQAESPTGQGFAAAAVSASKEYLASPQAADGSMAYGARTKLTISFQ